MKASPKEHTMIVSDHPEFNAEGLFYLQHNSYFLKKFLPEDTGLIENDKALKLIGAYSFFLAVHSIQQQYPDIQFTVNVEAIPRHVTMWVDKLFEEYVHDLLKNLSKGAKK